MSSNLRNNPCAEWAEKLAALHPDDLTSTEQDELKTHLASCRNCAEIDQDYRRLASLVRDLATTGVAPELLPGLPELPNEREETTTWSAPVSQPGTIPSLSARPEERRPWRTRKGAIAALAAVLAIGVFLGSFAIRGQYPVPGIVSQQPTPANHYVITPQGGPRPPSTPVVSSGPQILVPPTPPFFLDGNVYLNTHVYRANTGVPVRQYLKNLGDVEVYHPKLVNGVLYMAVRTADSSQKPGKMVMYALRASDGAVLWNWSDCGESVNMSPPTIINGAVYFICEAAPSRYKHYALQATTGKLLWLNTWSGEVGLNVLGDQHALYIQIGNQLLAERTDTGKLLWEKTFQSNGEFINYTDLGEGIIYVTQGTTFSALRTSDGELLWEYQLIGEYPDSEPIVDQNTVYLFTWEQSGPDSIYALDGTTGTMRWQKQLNQNEAQGHPIIDHGNLYMAINIVDTASQDYFKPFRRALLAIQGSDGHTLWQRDIPWNTGGLGYSQIAPPLVSAGDGRIYLVDWQPPVDPRNLQATMGAFSESNGALLWTRDIT